LQEKKKEREMLGSLWPKFKFEFEFFKLGLENEQGWSPEVSNLVRRSWPKFEEF
jgi:hypothetical protein